MMRGILSSLSLHLIVWPFYLHWTKWIDRLSWLMLGGTRKAMVHSPVFLTLRNVIWGSSILLCRYANYLEISRRSIKVKLRNTSTIATTSMEVSDCDRRSNHIVVLYIVQLLPTIT
jgi:hypothetical protein